VIVDAIIACVMLLAAFASVVAAIIIAF